MMMKACFSFLLLLLFVIVARAQDETDRLPFDDNAQQYSPARLYGRVIAGKSKKGVEAASIQVFVRGRDSSGRVKDSLIAGTLTRPNGDFSFYNLPLPDSFTVKITGIGLGEVVKQVAFFGGEQKAAG